MCERNKTKCNTEFGFVNDKPTYSHSIASVHAINIYRAVIENSQPHQHWKLLRKTYFLHFIRNVCYSTTPFLVSFSPCPSPSPSTLLCCFVCVEILFYFRPYLLTILPSSECALKYLIIRPLHKMSVFSTII